MSLQDLQTQLHDALERFNAWAADFVERTKVYFGQLDQMEQYGWVGEGVGFATFVAGIVLLIL